MARIVIIVGHPDPAPERLCNALAKAYEDGGRSAGHEVAKAHIGLIDFPMLRTRDDWTKGLETTPASLRAVQDAALNADHFLIIYPLWLGTMPGLLKGFLEQLFRPGVAFDYGNGGAFAKSKLKGKSARVVITMGMPSFAYRWFYFAHSLKSLERNILGFVGIGPIRTRLFGSVEAVSDRRRKGWIDEMRHLGQQAS